MSATDPAWGGATDAAPPPAIRLTGVHKSYGDAKPVLRGIDLSVATGERVCLIGSNGSGKSTLLRSVIGLNTVTEGQVETLGERFETQPSAAQRARLRRETGFVFQHHGLVRRRSVLSNVVHGMMGAPGSWRAFAQAIAPASWRVRALEALAEVNLADRALDRADALSGGQQQRVAIARALVRRPRLLIADEPAASLDPVAGRDVMELFVALCREHRLTLFFTSHDMDHAAAFSDRIVALKAGRVLWNKPSSAVREPDLVETFLG